MDKESQVKPLAPVRLDEVQALIKEAVGGESRLEMLKGFKLDFSGVADFHKVFFSAKCDCGTAALLSIEVSKDKTLPEVEESLPSLMDHLNRKVGQFRSMNCEMHRNMRMGGQPGPAANTPAGATG